MKATIYFAQYGEMEDGMKWANCQISSPFDAEISRSGCQVVKTNIITENDNQVSKDLVKVLTEAGKPIDVELTTSMKIQKQSPVLIITGFKLLSSKPL
ncbi:hypothetical protein HB763_16395 [Vibrio campbellii]|uniref:hypothetical protein n=1 Tax=Vibrio campbellii TaxID=680 RepID=UPI00210E9C61|nr:hypothetical protein [Vibrio campbellii]UTZ38244.1 hypothetical protein HB763_16355 [Vibrio campbellii]UTZ38252.1 hypothetical protein HB763_16395 [Vibrio campbellii]